MERAAVQGYGRVICGHVYAGRLMHSRPCDLMKKASPAGGVLRYRLQAGMHIFSRGRGTHCDECDRGVPAWYAAAGPEDARQVLQTKTPAEKARAVWRRRKVLGGRILCNMQLACQNIKTLFLYKNKYVINFVSKGGWFQNLYS